MYNKKYIYILYTNQFRKEEKEGNRRGEERKE